MSSGCPAWLNSIDYFNSLIFNGIKATSLISLKNMLVSMSDEQNEMLSIVVQLNDCQLTFEPSLVPMTSQLSLGEILLNWIDSFVHRGDLIQPIGNSKSTNFSQMISEDPLIIELKDKIVQLIEETSFESLKLFEAFQQYSFLYELPVNQSFQLFLNGEKRIKSSTPKNFLNEQDAGRRLVFRLLNIHILFLINNTNKLTYFSFSMLYRFDLMLFK